MVLERAPAEIHACDAQGFVTVEVAALEHVIQQIYSAGLLMARPTQSQAADDARAAVAERLDGAVRSFYLMVLRSQIAPIDLHSIVARITTAAHELDELTETMNDGARMLLNEATQSLHHALVALGDVDDYMER